MSPCSGYTPKFGIGQLDGSQFAGFNCTAWSAARACDDDTCGATKPSSAQVRTWTGDTSGGLNLAQVDAALTAHTPTRLDVLYRYPWADFAKRIDAGRSAILQGGYGPIADSRFDAGNGFRGNHAIFVPPGWAVMDPLADGRYPNVYKYSGEAYPQSLLTDFAGHLDTGNGNRLGVGLVYAAFTRDNDATYSMHFTAGAFWVYRLVNGLIASRVAKRFTKDTSAACTAPARYRWPGHTDRTLCQMTAGALKGQYVSIPQSNLRLVTVP